MNTNSGVFIAVLAAVVAIVVVLVGGPLVASIAIALVGGLWGSAVSVRRGTKDESVGIRR